MIREPELLLDQRLEGLSEQAVLRAELEGLEDLLAFVMSAKPFATVFRERKVVQEPPFAFLFARKVQDPREETATIDDIRFRAVERVVHKETGSRTIPPTKKSYWRSSHPQARLYHTLYQASVFDKVIVCRRMSELFSDFLRLWSCTYFQRSVTGYLIERCTVKHRPDSVRAWRPRSLGGWVHKVSGVLVYSLHAERPSENCSLGMRTRPSKAPVP